VRLIVGSTSMLIHCVLTEWEEPPVLLSEWVADMIIDVLQNSQPNILLFKFLNVCYKTFIKKHQIFCWVSGFDIISMYFPIHHFQWGNFWPLSKYHSTIIMQLYWYSPVWLSFFQHRLTNQAPQLVASKEGLSCMSEWMSEWLTNQNSMMTVLKGLMEAYFH
jgi:hypothetical protein